MGVTPPPGPRRCRWPVAAARTPRPGGAAARNRKRHTCVVRQRDCGSGEGRKKEQQQVFALRYTYTSRISIGPPHPPLPYSSIYSSCALITAGDIDENSITCVTRATRPRIVNRQAAYWPHTIERWRVRHTESLLSRLPSRVSSLVAGLARAVL